MSEPTRRADQLMLDALVALRADAPGDVAVKAFTLAAKALVEARAEGAAAERGRIVARARAAIRTANDRSLLSWTEDRGEIGVEAPPEKAE